MFRSALFDITRVFPLLSTSTNRKRRLYVGCGGTCVRLSPIPSLPLRIISWKIREIGHSFRFARDCSNLVELFPYMSFISPIVSQKGVYFPSLKNSTAYLRKRGSWRNRSSSKTCVSSYSHRPTYRNSFIMTAKELNAGAHLFPSLYFCLGFSELFSAPFTMISYMARKLIKE